MESLEMTRGDTNVIPVVISNPLNISSGNPTGLVDLTGATFTATFRDYDDTVVAVKTLGNGIVLNGSPANGQILITLDPADTSVLDYDQVLYFDVEMVEAGGRKTTVSEGLLTVFVDQTRP